MMLTDLTFDSMLMPVLRRSVDVHVESCCTKSTYHVIQASLLWTLSMPPSDRLITLNNCRTHFVSTPACRLHSLVSLPVLAVHNQHSREHSVPSRRDPERPDRCDHGSRRSNRGCWHRIRCGAHPLRQRYIPVDITDCTCTTNRKRGSYMHKHSVSTLQIPRRRQGKSYSCRSCHTADSIRGLRFLSIIPILLCSEVTHTSSFVACCRVTLSLFPYRAVSLPVLLCISHNLSDHGKDLQWQSILPFPP